MQEILSTFSIPFFGAVTVSGFLVLTDRKGIRNILFLLMIMFASWMQAINHDWKVGLITLVAGWVSGTVLYISENQQENGMAEGEGNLPSGLALRAIALAIVFLTAYSIGTSYLLQAYGLPESTALAGVFLGAVGLLQMSLTTNPHHLGHGILLLLTGFEIIFIWIEPALAVQFLLILVKVMISVVMSFLGGSSDTFLSIRSSRS
ncbi:MAG: hypothetical protein JXA25_07545 [Anaerolineales bacterium]|nr:hypothetical protein [Anaerolineales bacterium]